jgi:hypothetical protein
MNRSGFAGGLGKPVIYTCKKCAFDDTHFDTNHHLAIVWEYDQLENAAKRLKAVIRETLPTEANLETE